MADEETDGKLYTWETEYEKTWEILQENEEGSLQPAVDDIIHRAKRRRLLDRPANVRLGMMRHLFLVLDMSKAMEDQDLKPNRLISSLKLLEYFVEEFFDQNPISQLGIIVTKNKRAEKVMELGGNPRSHINAFQKLKDNSCEGEPSIQNSLELAGQTLRNMPAHASREVLIIFGSLTTCDPGDIHKTIKMMTSQNIRCSVIGLAANVHVCRKLTTETQGKYHVIMDESHYKDLLNMHLSPPPAAANTESSLIKMGFPHHRLQSGNSKEEMVALCMCHLDSKDPQQLGQGGYFCPQCRSKYCELPVECKACGLTLVSAPHLARSYHHLFPLDAFTEVLLEGMLNQSQRFCSACQKHLSEPKGYQCKYCKQFYCIDCDLFIHETLHCCPTCASARGKQTTT